MTYTYGVDIASWQGFPDFAQLKAKGNLFAISKVTGEGQYVNPYWSQNRDAARAAGVLYGYYDWVEPQVPHDPHDPANAGILAARDYLRVVGPLQAGELITVDFETPDWHTGPFGRDIEAFMRAYLYTLREEAGCQEIIVYTGTYFLQETGAERWDWLGRDFILWLAAPGPGMMADDSFWPGTPAPFTPDKLRLHQHQWFATSDAVVGQFDRDRFNGPVAELAALGYGGVAAAATPATPGGNVIEPVAGKFTAYINGNQETIFVWNAGGEATQIDGIAVVDLGVSVINAAGEKYDRSIQGNAVQVWNPRPKP